MKTTILGFIALLVLSLGSEAAVYRMVQIKGKVMDLKADIVTLETQTGPVKIQRKFFKKPNQVKPGQVLVVEANLEEVVALNEKTRKQ